MKCKILIYSVQSDSYDYSLAAFAESVGGVSYEIKAEVGLLSRNIRIIGADYSDMFSESFGARVIVGMQTELDENGEPKPHVGEDHKQYGLFRGLQIQSDKEADVE